MQNEVLVHVRSTVYAEWWYSARTEHGICKTALKRTYEAWYMQNSTKTHVRSLVYASTSQTASQTKKPAHGWYSL